MGQTRQDRLRSSSTNIAMALDRASEPVQGKTCAVKSHTMQIKVPQQFCVRYQLEGERGGGAALCFLPCLLV